LISPAYKNAEQENGTKFSLPIFTLQLEVSHGYKQGGQKSWQEAASWFSPIFLLVLKIKYPQNHLP